MERSSRSTVKDFNNVSVTNKTAIPLIWDQRLARNAETLGLARLRRNCSTVSFDHVLSESNLGRMP